MLLNKVIELVLENLRRRNCVMQKRSGFINDSLPKNSLLPTMDHAESTKNNSTPTHISSLAYSSIRTSRQVLMKDSCKQGWKLEISDYYHYNYMYSRKANASQPSDHRRKRLKQSRYHTETPCQKARTF